MDWKIWVEGYRNYIIKQSFVFHYLLRKLEANEKLSYDELINYQNKRLRLTIIRAARSVPYYRALFEELKIEPSEIRTLEDLNKIPILRKEDIRENERDFLSTATRFYRTTHTSGTTGKSITLYRDFYNINFENAALWRQWRWAGYQMGEKRAVLRSAVVVPADQNQPPFWKYYPGEKTLMMSSFHLSEKNIPHYLNHLREFMPAAIQAYPSSIVTLARYMEMHNEPPIPVKAVFTSSELLYPDWREAIEKYFGKVFDHYGQAERNASIGMCEFGNYHYAMDYSILEFLPYNEDYFEIIGTSLHNPAMPLIRYATGDLVKIGKRHCPCGRAFPVVESIEGKNNDFIISPSGKRIGGSFITLAYWGVPNIKESQIIQQDLSNLNVLVVPDENYSIEDEKLLINRLYQRFGSEFKITIEQVDSINRTEAGKYRLVVSKLSN